MERKGFLHWFIIGTFSLLYLFVSVISMIHVVDFFQLSNATWLSITLAIAFELGAAASLASVIVVDKMNKFIVWGLFILLTCFQMMGNAYFAYAHIHDYSGWAELFGLMDLSDIEQKRILAIVSGAILPVVALGFIKCLVDYLKPEKMTSSPSQVEAPEEVAVEKPVENVVEEKKEVKEVKEPQSVKIPLDEIMPKKEEEKIPEVKAEDIPNVDVIMQEFPENFGQEIVEEEEEQVGSPLIEGSPRDVIEISTVDDAAPEIIQTPVKRTSLFKKRK